ncbi:MULTISPECIES: hypothetical protein [Methylobacterium]|uniref:Uncharacterized protein n=1 Tax=Methylobacterium thuringiense TaxID=1003091 RepID=A0ABQ4TQQ6_9HYPH|nr:MULTISPECIES: hypothetical protein [Methylobacterium]TXN22802.1 hypothetical protein FV217_09280 [Methylobacterium sp. WL9]GJE57002.1 hypothetical protein EKPJFOCH_3512 [Methylobacterium thuringiense]
MTRLLTASALALALVGAVPAAALAQSYNAPAGIPAQAAPGTSVEQGAGHGWTAATPGTYDSLTTGSVTQRSHQNGTARR